MSLNGTLKALSDPIRRNILTMLKGKKMIAGDIAEELGISPASLSYHLNLLKKNDLVIESKEKNYEDMSKFLFLYMWIAGWMTCCLACLYQPFMNIWVGRNLMLSLLNMFLFCLYFYCLQMGVIRGVYYDAAGLWWYGKFRAFSEAILNIVLNIVLGKFFGITGIIVATLISLILINQCFFEQPITHRHQVLFFYHSLKLVPLKQQ